MVSNDLTADGNDELAGYWGGFSGDVDGEVFGFLSPLFNGDEFHGNAVQVHLAAAVRVCVHRVQDLRDLAILRGTYTRGQ